MKKTTELNPERSEKYRYLDQLGYVPKFIIISACCGFLAGVAVVLSVLATYNSTDANAKVDYELPRMRDDINASENRMTDRVDKSVSRTDLYIVYVQDLQAELKVQGFKIPPLPEE